MADEERKTFNVCTGLRCTIWRSWTETSARITRETPTDGKRIETKIAQMKMFAALAKPFSSRFIGRNATNFPKCYFWFHRDSVLLFAVLLPPADTWATLLHAKSPNKNGNCMLSLPGDVTFATMKWKWCIFCIFSVRLFLYRRISPMAFCLSDFRCEIIHADIFRATKKCTNETNGQMTHFDFVSNKKKNTKTKRLGRFGVRYVACRTVCVWWRPLSVSVRQFNRCISNSEHNRK